MCRVAALLALVAGAGVRRGLALAVLGVALLAGRGAGAEELTLSVAISMKEAVEELGRAFGQAHRGVVLRYNLGASGDLQKQIEAGAPVDVFVSAGQRQMDELERKGLLVPGTRRVFARNVLVVVVPGGGARDVTKAADLLEPRVSRIAIGNPRTVPVGQYAEESLRALGLWERLQPKLVPAENVRQVLEYVARGEVDAGFVYATDIGVRPAGVREAFRVPEDSYSPVLYPAAVVAGSRVRSLAAAFVDLLAGAEGQAVLRRFGFLPALR
jgi:molybdate transport system substrate-binding protein